MFGSADDPDEERLECMVKLLQTCGKKLDDTGSPDTVKVRYRRWLGRWVGLGCGEHESGRREGGNRRGGGGEGEGGGGRTHVVASPNQVF